MALTNLKKNTYRSAANDWPTSSVVNVQMGGYPPPPVKSWMKSGGFHRQKDDEDHQWLMITNG